MVLVTAIHYSLWTPLRSPVFTLLAPLCVQPLQNNVNFCVFHYLFSCVSTFPSLFHFHLWVNTGVVICMRRRSYLVHSWNTKRYLRYLCFEMIQKRHSVIVNVRNNIFCIQVNPTTITRTRATCSNMRFKVNNNKKISEVKWEKMRGNSEHASGVLTLCIFRL